MKKSIVMFFTLIIVVLLNGCGKVDKLIQDIDTNLEKGSIAPITINELWNQYNSLSNKEKGKITNYYRSRNIDIEKIKLIRENITELPTSSPFKDVVQIFKKYENLNEDEKSLLDIEKINDLMKMTNIEKAAVAACQYVKKILKSSSSFELYDASIIDDINGSSRYYLVNISYSATNSFGGRKDDTSFQTINDKFKNPWYELSFIDGDYSTALKCTPYQKFYLLSTKDPIKIDCDKIIYYIDTEIS